jgi:hypothetical protein
VDYSLPLLYCNYAFPHFLLYYCITVTISLVLSQLSSRLFVPSFHAFILFSLFVPIFLASSSRFSLSFNSLASQHRRPLIRIRACISAPWLALLSAHKSKPTLAITHFYANQRLVLETAPFIPASDG